MEDGNTGEPLLAVRSTAGQCTPGSSVDDSVPTTSSTPTEYSTENTGTLDTQSTAMDATAVSWRDGSVHLDMSTSNSGMAQQPVTLSWENIDVFVTDKQKKDRKKKVVEVDAERNEVAPSSAPKTKNGKKQILTDGMGKLMQLLLFILFINLCACFLLLLAYLSI